MLFELNKQNHKNSILLNVQIRVNIVQLCRYVHLKMFPRYVLFLRQHYVSAEANLLLQDGSVRHCCKYCTHCIYKHKISQLQTCKSSLSLLLIANTEQMASLGDGPI